VFHSRHGGLRRGNDSGILILRTEKRMAQKKKKQRLRVGKEARRRARLGIGPPPPERTIPNKRDKAAKHKETLGRLLSAPE
jgi:hypothetical protein